MDTLTHALSAALLGRVLARPASASTPPLHAARAMAAGAVAAAFPDIDVVFGYVSEIAYLRGHRGVTHSVLLAPLWALLLAVMLSRIGRLGRGGAPPWRAFYPVALGGLLIQYCWRLHHPVRHHAAGALLRSVFHAGYHLHHRPDVFRHPARRPAGQRHLAAQPRAGRPGTGCRGRLGGRRLAGAERSVGGWARLCPGLAMVTLDAALRPASPFNCFATACAAQKCAGRGGCSSWWAGSGAGSVQLAPGRRKRNKHKLMNFRRLRAAS